MAGVRIHDSTDEQVLVFDLTEIVEALGKNAELSAWKCSAGECIAQDGARPDLEDAYNAPAGLAGPDFIAHAADTLQVVDGVFEASCLGEKRPWIKLEAIDSTYWEVFAGTAADLESLRLRFSEVEAIEQDGV